MEFFVLGPLEYRVDGTVAVLGGPKQRAVLAHLLAHPGEVVSLERLIVGVWGPDGAPSLRSSVHTYISNLRSIVGYEIERVGDGYRLNLPPDAIDSVVFERMVGDAERQRSVNPATASHLARQALALWRGRAFADLDGVHGLQTEVRRLDDARLRAVELRIDTDIELGRHRAVIGELEALTTEHPLNEGLHAKLMLALYRDGRQADALRIAGKVRAHLAETLGVDPTPELLELEDRILQHDPALDSLREARTEDVASLFTGIEESTPLSESQPEWMQDSLARHDAVMADSVQRHAGTVAKHIGDGVIAGDQWRLVAVVAAVVVAIAAVLIANRNSDESVVPGVAMATTTVTTTVTTTASPEVESDLASSGAFDRGRDETLSLDPETAERLRGVAAASLEGEADAVAVAADGALGVIDGTTLRIVVGNDEIATREFVSSYGEFDGGQRAIAFDTEGSLWVWTGGGLAGLRRNGSSVDVEDVVPPITSPGVSAGLRIKGTDVSVVLYDLDRPAWAEVFPIVGEDSLAGVQTFDNPIPPAGQALPSGVPYIDAPQAIVTSELLLAGSIVGSARAELDWQDPPSDAGGYEGTTSQSQIVADTSASLLWMSLYNGSFLIVHRSDGTAAVALVDAGEGAQVDVSPDGAVHLLTIDNGTTTVRTLLDADLRPLLDADIRPLPGPPRFVCGEPGPDEQVVDDVDLDGDGVLDRVTLDEEGVILACLADGGQSAMAGWPAASLARADLGGVDGLIVTLQSARFHTQNYLVRLEGGELGVVGDAQVTVSGDLGGAPGLVHVADGVDFPTGPEVDQGTPGSFGVLGCRPSVLGDADFDAITLIHFPDDRLYAETATVYGMLVGSLDVLAPDLVPELPDSARRADLDQVLRDLGFSPGCRPVGPDDAPVTPSPRPQPTRVEAACEEEQPWDTRLDLDGDGSTDRVTLAARGVEVLGNLVACLADGRVASIEVHYGPQSVRDGRLRLSALDLSGTPAVAMITPLGTNGDSGVYEVFALGDDGLVELTPSSFLEGTLDDLRLWGNTRVETFGCRPTVAGGVEFVELLIERVDRDLTTDPGSPAYAGDRLAVSYVLRTAAPDLTGIGDPTDRVDLPEFDGETARPAEILADLGATWLCRP